MQNLNWAALVELDKLTAETLHPARDLLSRLRSKKEESLLHQGLFALLQFLFGEQTDGLRKTDSTTVPRENGHVLVKFVNICEVFFKGSIRSAQLNGRTQVVTLVHGCDCTPATLSWCIPHFMLRLDYWS